MMSAPTSGQSRSNPGPSSGDNEFFPLFFCLSIFAALKSLVEQLHKILQIDHIYMRVIDFFQGIIVMVVGDNETRIVSSFGANPFD